jgi:DNA-binding NarL/FixJ family response regulator
MRTHVEKIRILLADDHPAVLSKVAAILEGTCQIIGSVTDGRAVLDAAAQQCPDVILMDISMPIMNGIEASEYLIQRGTKSKIIFLTVHDDPDFLRAALATGASGYVIKSRMATDLVPAISEALAGHRFVSLSYQPKDPNAP